VVGLGDTQSASRASAPAVRDAGAAAQLPDLRSREAVEVRLDHGGHVRQAAPDATAGGRLIRPRSVKKKPTPNPASKQVRTYEPDKI
jgi:hypothetical protein